MGLGVGFPVSVSAMGGHFMFDDDQETPTLQTLLSLSRMGKVNAR
jgi:hypothetical protein